MTLLTRDDLRRHSWFTWFCMAMLAGIVALLWMFEKRSAAQGTALAMLGCLALILPPRERMAVLPWRVRALPRNLDSTLPLATLLASPGYGLNLFYGANPYDEVVHLLSGMLAGAVFAGLLAADGRPRTLLRLSAAGAAFGLGLAVAWEAFEWAIGIIGNWTDTWTDVLLTGGGATLGTVWHGRTARLARA